MLTERTNQYYRNAYRDESTSVPNNICVGHGNTERDMYNSRATKRDSGYRSRQRNDHPSIAHTSTGAY